ncbi:c-type cytochrome [Acidobacteria bacterium AB60]|nr:c-type cytochrome [Acidobacteria bacterium AB60]
MVSIILSLGCGPAAAQANPAAGAEVSPPVKQQAHPGNDPGAQAYARNCAVCHGDEREGNLPGFPPLVGIRRRMNDDQLTTLIHAGKGRMPAFPQLQDGELSALMQYLGTAAPAVASASKGAQATGQAAAGEALFHQNCAFCHGRDAMGGETGPDLTQSKLVIGDKTGERIAQTIREGRVDPKMPAFNFSSEEVASLIAFIRWRIKAAAEHPGGRRGVSVADLQTGNAEKGKAYFNGAGGCAKCHSPTGDLAGIASRFQGLQLEQRMLYPRGARPKVTVTLPSGEKIAGTLAYEDEFVIGLRDAHGAYRSWRTDRVKYQIDDPAEAHVDQFPKYTDDDVHNLMAYLQTLK